MKQQHLLFMAMAILVLYSLTFPQKELNQNASSNDHIKIANGNSKQIASSKVDEFDTQIAETEYYVRTKSDLTSPFFIQNEENDIFYPAIAFNFSRIDFGMNRLQI